LVEIKGGGEYNIVVLGNARSGRSSFGRDPKVRRKGKRGCLKGEGKNV